ncbi:unnamed protein product [Brugia pahangi]|uniref:Uncharacterized protein n=1 Tax=Brugia pahangi TaxID=6280 RepID=A0A0N4T7H9_BRUPA|nr:unnamed protein product [Brugia pahangi]
MHARKKTSVGRRCRQNQLSTSSWHPAAPFSTSSSPLPSSPLAAPTAATSQSIRASLRTACSVGSPQKI